MAQLTVLEARLAARDWVMREGTAYDGYVGAYVSGSTVGLAAHSLLPVGTDVDIMLVTRQPIDGLKLGKFLHRGALLEVTYLDWNTIAPAEQALSDYHLAGGLSSDTVIDDPTGELRELQRQVAAAFADEAWVRRRCEHVRRRIENALGSPDPRAPWYDRVTGWLFPTGVTTHLMLVAATRNPTVRLRYLRAREALADAGLSHHYPALLRQLGSQNLTRARVEHHIDALAATFDATAAVSKTPFFFSTDITPAARPIAIDAGRELALRGDHREAVFWIVATFARCQKILASDAPALRQEWEPAFADLLADIGITGGESIQDRASRTLDELPELWKIAEEIITNNPAVNHR